ncbi:MAG: GTP-binding protein [Cyanobacteria bacterium J06639_14]
MEDFQSELAYNQAKGVLQSLLERLKLTPREASGLQNEIQQLTALLQKLDQAVIHIAVFGLVGRGKSSLLNALAGKNIFATGPTHGVTQQVQRTQWTTPDDLLTVEDASAQRISLPGLGQSRLELIDTPGLDEVNGQAHAQLAQAIVSEADLILFVTAGDITRIEYDALAQLRQAGKPILLVFNKADQYPEVDRQTLYENLQGDRWQNLIAPDEVVMTAAAPLVAVQPLQSDGRRRPILQRGQPQVDALKLKILEVLHREGLSLVALNTLLYADELNETILAQKRQIREQAAHDVIWNSVMTKAIAVALNPITVLDLLTGTIIDVAMILTLSRLYGLPMTQTGATKLFKTIALELGGLSISELVVTFGLSSLKGLLGASAPATGGLSLAPYTSVAIAQAAVVGIATYGIGQVTKEYLTHGAKWGSQGPKSVVNSILDSLDETSILNRIKADLAAKVGRRVEE